MNASAMEGGSFGLCRNVRSGTCDECARNGVNRAAVRSGTSPQNVQLVRFFAGFGEPWSSANNSGHCRDP
jgi:hypothetical protein